MTTTTSPIRFIDRTDAGRKLAHQLVPYVKTEVVVYALPRGGVVTGIEVARILHAPLDLIIPRKIGHPTDPEYAIGAVAEDGHLVGDPQELGSVDQQWLQTEIAAQRSEARRRRETYLGDRHPLTVTGKIAIIVDDGIATGLTMQCAIAEVRHRNPSQIVIATPLAPEDTLTKLRPLVDDVICLSIPRVMGSIGSFYDFFPQVEDVEVIRLMRDAATI